MRILFRVVVIVFVVAVPVFVFAQGIEWSLVNWKVRHEFPSVRRISPNELSQWLNDKSRPQPVLLDVRTQPEYDVSKIHGARRVEPGGSADELQLPKDEPIVTYCSVGYRSAAFARKLQEAGYTKVQNLSGSIFQWANEGRPVERDGQRVYTVHPYNNTWGKLLKPQLRATVR